jgi:hypothetical protein
VCAVDTVQPVAVYCVPPESPYVAVTVVPVGPKLVPVKTTASPPAVVSAEPPLCDVMSGTAYDVVSVDTAVD